MICSATFIIFIPAIASACMKIIFTDEEFYQAEPWIQNSSHLTCMGMNKPQPLNLKQKNLLLFLLQPWKVLISPRS